ncbi:MAG: Ig-like domain-containing protein [Bacteroidota bacterium]
MKLLFLTITTLLISVSTTTIAQNWLRAEMYTIPVSVDNNLGTANLFWQVSLDSSVVTVDQGAGQADFAAAGSTGNASAPWIQIGIVYHFRLFKIDGDNRIPVDSIRVSGTDPLPNSAIGMNGFPLFVQYLGISQGNGDYQNKAHRRISKAMAKKSIISAAEIGAKYFRTMVSGFYSMSLNVWENDPDFYWKAMDEFIDELQANDIKLIPSMAWNLFQFPDYCAESITDFVTVPNSASYIKYKQFISDFVTRYKDSNVILFYEIGNEYNLHADLKHNTHPFTGQPYSGQFTTYQLADFQKRTADYIRSLDSKGMVSSGNALPRTAAYHLMLQPQFSPLDADWTPDNVDQFKEYIGILEEGVDIISGHMYNSDYDGNRRFGITDKNSAELLSYLEQASAEAGKLLFMGEFGDYDPMIQQDTTAQFTQNMFNKIVELNIPFSAPWIWDFYQYNTYEFTPFQIEQGFTDLIIEKYKEANVALGNDPVVIENPDTVKPLVVLTYPKGNTDFTTPTQLVHAVASDNSGSIDKVEFYVNGEVWYTDTEPPYQFDMNSDTLNIRTTEITAAAYDHSGNIANFMLEKYLVQTTGTITADPDTVTEFADNGSGTLVGTTTLSWTASGCENILLYVQMDGGDEALMTNASLNSSMTAPWIQPGHEYSFIIYSAYGDLNPVDMLSQVTVIGKLISSVEEIHETSNNIKLSNAPNPFNNSTVIYFDNSKLKNEDNVDLMIFDVLGRLIEKVKVDVNSNKIYFNANGYSSGIYYYMLQVDGRNFDSNSMVILK